MKTGSIFFGSFFIALGGLFLVKNFGVETTSIDNLAKFWPLILITLGVSYLVGNEVIARALSAVSGVLCGVIVWTLLQNPIAKGSVVEFDNNNPDAKPQRLVAIYDGKVPRAKCKLDVSVGELALNESTIDLLRIDAKTTFGDYELRQMRKDDVEEVEIEQQKGRLVHSSNNKATNQLKLALNPNPLWTIEAEIGAAKADFDLSPFRVQRVDVEASAASVKLKLGERCDTVQIRLNATASNVNLLLPNAAGCEIFGNDDFLSKIHVEDFVKRDGARFQTENFSSAKKKIRVELEGGLYNLNIERY